MSYFVENLSNPVATGHDYPGLRFDTSNELQAAQAFRAATGAAPGDRLRVVLDGPNYMFFFDVLPGSPVTVPSLVRPVVPPIGQ